MKSNHLNDLLQQADSLQQELQENRDWQQQSVQEAFSIEYTYDSNRIEGNTLTLRETELVIHKGLTVGGKPMVEHLEAINHYEAVALLRDVVKEKTALNRSLLLSLHGLILRGIDRDNAGRFRSVPVMISGSRHVPPQPWQLDQLMEDYFNGYVERKIPLHPILLAANMHERLVSIHPFIDGNGRTARLIMNLILLQHGFPIAIIHGDMASRLAYYHALEKCNLQDDTSDFHALIALAVVATMKRLLALVKRDK
jgi:Fic family protein